MLSNVVSAYYKIPSKFSSDTYLRWIYNFLHYIPCHLVFFTTEDLIPLFTSMRGQWMDRTRFVALPLNEWMAWKRYGWSFWKDQHTLDPEAFRHSAELYAVWYEKKEYVLRAIEMNPWGHGSYIWCDAGAWRDISKLSSLTEFGSRWNYDLRMVLLQLEPFTEEERTGKVRDLTAAVRLGGGVQASSIDGWKHWSTEYDQMLLRLHSEKMFVGKDQNIMGHIVLNRHPVELVAPDVSVGDIWFTLLYKL